MRIYKCDWCGKEIGQPVQQSDFYRPAIIDLCSECNKKYEVAYKELCEYDKQLKEEFEKRMLKKREEIIKRIKEEN